MLLVNPEHACYGAGDGGYSEMIPDPAETLRIFFEIPHEVILRDIERAEADYVGLTDEIAAWEDVPPLDRTSQSEAHQCHLFLVKAAVAFKNEHVQPELKTFFAAMGSGHVVSVVEDAADTKDNLGKLKTQMAAIERREGLKPGEFWVYRNEGPDDYRALEDQRDEIFERIEHTVYPMVLRRYGLNEMADLYERDFATFEIQREIGSRVIHPRQEEDAEVQKLIDGAITREHGEEALEKIRRRVEEIRATVGL